MYIICRVSHLCVRGDISHSTISVVHPQLYSSEISAGKIYAMYDICKMCISLHY